MSADAKHILAMMTTAIISEMVNVINIGPTGMHTADGLLSPS